MSLKLELYRQQARIKSTRKLKKAGLLATSSLKVRVLDNIINKKQIPLYKYKKYYLD